VGQELIKKEAMMRSVVVLGALAGIVLLSACGNDEPDRAQGGAATGAATGAAVGLVGGPVGVVVGGLIGGAAGATTGAVTSPQTVDLGPPPWSEKYGYQAPPQPQPMPPTAPSQQP
jgi:phage tail tape-measure protein